MHGGMLAERENARAHMDDSRDREESLMKRRDLVVSSVGAAVGTALGPVGHEHSLLRPTDYSQL